MSDLDRKKAEVRKRMEAQSNAKKKKGFMTPERKKKLRVSDVQVSISKRSFIKFCLCSCYLEKRPLNN